VGFSLQKQFQIQQAVLWNSTVFLKGEAHKTGKRINYCIDGLEAAVHIEHFRTFRTFSRRTHKADNLRGFC